nr:ATPase, T2SS/T4P/T4SS family [Candidatus Sigynarchaeota archaeon]
MNMREITYLVPDLSSIVNFKVLDFLDKTIPDARNVTVLIDAGLMAHVEYAAGKEEPSGILALQHLATMTERVAKGDFKMNVMEIEARGKEISIDESCRKIAMENDALLLTCNPVQETMCKIEGIHVQLLELHLEAPVEALFGTFFDDQTMSVHLVEGMVPRGKKGRPGAWQLVDIGTEPSSKADLARLVNEIINLTTLKGNARGFLEINYEGAKVVSFGKYRIAIAHPPVSMHYEITVTRPLVKFDLQHYNLPKELVERFMTEAEGILVAGPPGAGKSTFASAIANFYAAHQKIVKTLESVRDLQVSPGISQYGAVEGEMEKNADLLLLVRPDYTIFDEVRRTKEFEIFVDLRQAGVGMVGVVHASTPIDAIQRFISRIDLGILPQVIDTVVFINDGEIKDVLGVRMVVKIPKGFRDEGLARPVVEVFSFFDKRRVLYEIYTFGENVVVIPVDKPAEKRYKREQRSYIQAPIDVDNDETVQQPSYKKLSSELTPVAEINFMGGIVEFVLGAEAASRSAVLCTKRGEPLIYATVGPDGTIRVRKKSKKGKKIDSILSRTREIFYKLL